MFWRFGFHTQSALDTLLEKESFTLEEVLDEEELLQECKAQNKKLIDYFCQPDVLESLLAYIVEVPSEELDDKVKYKYPNLAAEVFGCEVNAISEALINNQNLLEEFWKFLEQPTALNPLQGSYFSRVFNVLLQTKTEETIIFIKKQEKPLDHMMVHIGNSGVMELLLKLISCEEVREGEGIVQWLIDNGLITMLIDKFDPVLEPDIHSNASQAVAEIVSLTQNFGTRNLIIENLKSETMVSRLLDLLVRTDAPNINSAILNGLSVVIDIIQRGLGFFQEMDTNEVEFKEEDLSELLNALIPKLPIFHDLMIKTRPPNVDQDITQGSIENPLHLGAIRLKIIELFVIVLHANHPDVNQLFLDLKIVPCYLDLFFRYQWNNFLHSFVHDMLVKIFSSDLTHSKELILAALIDGELLDKIVEAARGNDADIEEHKGIRRGYMGHLILISNHISKFSELPEIPDEVELQFKKEAWIDYEKEILNETNQRDNKPLGGHRPIQSHEDDDIHGLGHSDFRGLGGILGSGNDTSHDQYDDDDDFDMDDDTYIIKDDNNPFDTRLAELDDSDEEVDSPGGWADFSIKPSEMQVNNETEDKEGKEGNEDIKKEQEEPHASQEDSDSDSQEEEEDSKEPEDRSA